MKKLLGILIVCSMAFAVNADYLNVNTGSKKGKFVKTEAPNYGYITVVQKSKPANSLVATGSIVLYGKPLKSAVDIGWIAKDVSGNITSGNITGI